MPLPNEGSKQTDVQIISDNVGRYPASTTWYHHVVSPLDPGVKQGRLVMPPFRDNITHSNMECVLHAGEPYGTLCGGSFVHEFTMGLRSLVFGYFERSFTIPDDEYRQMSKEEAQAVIKEQWLIWAGDLFDLFTNDVYAPASEGDNDAPPK